MEDAHATRRNGGRGQHNICRLDELAVLLPHPPAPTSFLPNHHAHASHPGIGGWNALTTPCMMGSYARSMSEACKLVGEDYFPTQRGSEDAQRTDGAYCDDMIVAIGGLCGQPYGTERGRAGLREAPPTGLGTSRRAYGRYCRLSCPTRLWHTTPHAKVRGDSSLFDARRTSDPPGRETPERKPRVSKIDADTVTSPRESGATQAAAPTRPPGMSSWDRDGVGQLRIRPTVCAICPLLRPTSSPAYRQPQPTG